MVRMDDAVRAATSTLRPMPRRTGLFIAIIAGTLAISLDFASIDLALPALQRQFGLDLDGVQWVINGYVMAFAVCMVTGGRLADAYGRRRIFLVGLAIFGIASLLGGFAWNGPSLVAFRVLQGVGAALLWPAMVGLACAAVGERNRGFAIGLVMGTCSIGNSAGPIVGGALTEWFSWRWVLWINVPMALIAMAITLVRVEKDATSPARPGNDFLGTALLCGGLVAMMIAVDEALAWGWGSARTLGLLALSAVLLGLFPVVERRRADAVIPPELLHNREFMSLCWAAVGVCQFFFVILLYVPQFAMKFLGDDAIGAGARVVTFMAGFGLVSFLGGRLYARLGARRLMIAGLASVGIGATLLAFVGSDGEPVIVNVLLLLVGLGVGAVLPTLSTRAVEVAGIERASLAGGVTFMLQLSGAALLLAVATTIFIASSRSSLAAALAREEIVLTVVERAATDNVLVGASTARSLATKIGTGSDSPLGPELIAAVRTACHDGMRNMLLFSASVVFLTLGLTIKNVRGGRS